MTTEQLKSLPSYEKLRSNGLTDQNIREFYSLPNGQRGAFLRSFQQSPPQQVITPPRQPRNESRAKFAEQGTQKCTQKEVNVEFEKYMNMDFIVQGKSYNLIELGYTFGWNNNKSRFGVHKLRWRSNMFGDKDYTLKRIELSLFMLKYSDKTISDWIDTILHEIAHAIDHAIRGTSNHDRHWVRVAQSIGCSGERCGNHKVDARASKYTLVCPNGHKTASHKRSKNVEQGRVSCGKCSKENGTKGFNRNYLLKQIQNY